MYSQFKIYEIIRKDSNTVVLDGQGGDEMFGGYIQYIYYRVYELLLAGKLSSLIRMISGSRQTISNSFLAKNITRLLLANKLPFLYQYLRNNQQDEVLKLDYFQKSNCEKLPSFDRNSLMDKLEADRNFQDLPRLLRYADRNSMAWSLESRVPFASQPIQSFVTKLNSKDIIDSNSLTKNLFRSAVEPYIPAEIFNRRDKKGFNSDDKAILTSTEARDFLESLPISTYAFINKDSLLKVLDCKNNYKIENLWRIFSLLKWLDQNKINL
jgi:asparagine synthase (glutamine-hydrolysing)